MKLSLDTCIERVKRDKGTPVLAPHGTLWLRENAAQWVGKVERISPGNTWEIGRHNKLWQRAFCCFFYLGTSTWSRLVKLFFYTTFWSLLVLLLFFHANKICRWNLIPHQDTKQGGGWIFEIHGILLKPWCEGNPSWSPLGVHIWSFNLSTSPPTDLHATTKRALTEKRP